MIQKYIGGIILEKLVITGKTPLRGEVKISGAKNAAVAIIPATLLINGICTIDNLPNISDVKLYCEILQDLGAVVTWNTPNEVVIDTRNVNSHQAPIEITGKFIFTFEFPHAEITASAKKLKGASIYMDVASVGATINTILAAVLAEGTTVIDNAAKEPHIVDVANFLNTMGADIRGAGTDIIKINGVKELAGNATYSVVPDQIEAGTFMLAAVASKGDIVIKNCITKHLEPIIAKVTEMGANVDANGDHLRVWCKKRPSRATIKTLPYPRISYRFTISNGCSFFNCRWYKHYKRDYLGISFPICC